MAILKKQLNNVFWCATHLNPSGNEPRKKLPEILFAALRCLTLRDLTEPERSRLGLEDNSKNGAQVIHAAIELLT